VGGAAASGGRSHRHGGGGGIGGTGPGGGQHTRPRAAKTCLLTIVIGMLALLAWRWLLATPLLGGASGMRNAECGSGS